MLPSAGGASSLVHKLAAALLPEPTTGSRLLAEEFGIKYDEGVEEIDVYGGDRFTFTVPVHRFIPNTLTRIPAPLVVDSSGSLVRRRRVPHDDDDKY
jgi:hypothetical protein